MFSIGGEATTYQAVKSVKESSGYAVHIDSKEAVLARALLAKTGILAETSSAAAIIALMYLVKFGCVGKGEKAMVILTSSGTKEEPIDPHLMSGEFNWASLFSTLSDASRLASSESLSIHAKL